MLTIRVVEDLRAKGVASPSACDKALEAGVEGDKSRGAPILVKLARIAKLVI